MEVVATASCGREALRLAGELRPDLAVVDLQLRDESGIDLARALSQAASPLPVILISIRDEDELAELIETAPIAGFIPKNRLSAASIGLVLADR
jgi:DNA-binding NarL/FixJ family response regulator